MFSPEPAWDGASGSPTPMGRWFATSYPALPPAMGWALRRSTEGCVQLRLQGCGSEHGARAWPTQGLMQWAARPWESPAILHTSLPGRGQDHEVAVREQHQRCPGLPPPPWHRDPSDLPGAAKQLPTESRGAPAGCLRSCSPEPLAILGGSAWSSGHGSELPPLAVGRRGSPSPSAGCEWDRWVAEGMQRQAAGTWWFGCCRLPSGVGTQGWALVVLSGAPATAGTAGDAAGE